jgi:phage terminase large subunit-like protein
MTEPIPIQKGAKRKPQLMGAVKPRIMSPALKGNSYGDAFAEFCKSCNYNLMPWQKFVADDFLTVDADGNFIRKTVAILVARQNGKSWLAAFRILFGLFELGEKSVVAMSSNRSMALTTFRQVISIIEANEHLRVRVKLNRGMVGRFANGQESIELKNGATYKVVAATRDGARGLTADLLFIDELREISEEAMKAAKPVTRARPNSQSLFTSNAGDAYSLVLNDLRERALSYPAKSLGWYEYSAPQHSKVDDRKAWAMANPALGITITEDVLAEAVSTDSVETIKTEMLCTWVSSLTSPWPNMAFEDCGDKTLQMGPGPLTFFAFDKAQNTRTASLVAGQLLPDGRIGVGILQQWRSEVAVDDLRIASDIKGWADKYNPAGIMFDHYATQSIAQRLAVSGCKMEDVSGQQFYQACGDLLDAIVAKRITHSGQPEFVESMNNCAAKTNEGSFRIIRRQSAGCIAAAISLAMIVHKMSQPVSIPQIVAV